MVKKYHKKTYTFQRDGLDADEGISIDRKTYEQAKSKFDALARKKDAFSILDDYTTLRDGADHKEAEVYLFQGGSVVHTYDSNSFCGPLLKIVHPTQEGADGIARILGLPVSEEENIAGELRKKCFVKGIGDVFESQDDDPEVVYASFKKAGKRALSAREFTLMALEKKSYGYFRHVAESALYIPKGKSLLISDAIMLSSFEQVRAATSAQRKNRSYCPPESLVEPWTKQAERDKNKDPRERKALILPREVLEKGKLNLSLEEVPSNEIALWLFERGKELKYRGLAERFAELTLEQNEKVGKENRFSKEEVENELSFLFLSYSKIQEKKQAFEHILDISRGVVNMFELRVEGVGTLENHLRLFGV